MFFFNSQFSCSSHKIFIFTFDDATSLQKITMKGKNSLCLMFFWVILWLMIKKQRSWNCRLTFCFIIAKYHIVWREENNSKSSWDQIIVSHTSIEYGTEDIYKRFVCRLEEKRKQRAHKDSSKMIFQCLSIV